MKTEHTCVKTVVCSRRREPQPLNLLHSPAQPRCFDFQTKHPKVSHTCIQKINYWSMVVSSSFVLSVILVLERWWTGRRSLLKR